MSQSKGSHARLTKRGRGRQGSGSAKRAAAVVSFAESGRRRAGKRHVAKPASAALIQLRVGATDRDRQVARKALRSLDL